MRLIADLHIHSKFSRATSADLDLENLTLWAKRKGIHVVGTGDLTHPAWFAELQEKLLPAEEGLFRLRPDLEAALVTDLPPSCRDHPVRFLLTVEVSTIYKKNGLLRKIHHVLCLPGLEAASKLRVALGRIGNLEADGRPIFGLDSRNLLEIVLETSPSSYLIPAHIWTPWFSLFGSRSGFDTIEECFEDLTPHIFALETGLSSDPAMNWRLSALDRFTMVSHSDAHSPGKLGREANLLDCDLSYASIFATIKERDPKRFLGTLEFYPEEGKYHFDGHRLCKVRFSPEETRQAHKLCPVCGQPLTVGVLSRIEALADRPKGTVLPDRPGFQNLVPLDEVIGQIFEQGPATQKVRLHYQEALQTLGSELDILRALPLEEIQKVPIPLFDEAIRRVRTGELKILPGYDGEYGKIQIFTPEESPLSRPLLFPITAIPRSLPPSPPPQMDLFGTLELEGTPEVAASSKRKRRRPAKAPAPTSIPRTPDGEEPSVSRNEGSSARDEASASGTSGVPLAQKEGLDAKGGAFGPSGVPLAQKEGLDAKGGAFGPSKAPGGSLGNEPRLLNPKHLLMGLNTEQKIAVKHTGTPILIVAGPGTGKTKTLTQRIGYLLATGAFAPEAILALTFTNKAAREMNERLQALLGGKHGVTVCTFHRLGWQLLSGDDHLPRLLGDTERLSILRDTEAAQGLSLTPRLLREALEEISRAKQASLSSQEAGCFDIPERSLPLFQGYQDRLRTEGWVDIDDLLLESVRKLREDEAFRKSIQSRYRSIHVDEYQDVNPIQVEFLKELVTATTDLCAIGDPDQAIYGFRGSDVRLFSRFSVDFGTPSRPVYRTSLWRNYRSPEAVLKAAFALISTQADPSRLPLESLQGGAAVVSAFEFPHERAEAEGIVRQIEMILGGVSGHPSETSAKVASMQEAGLGLGDIAILYRSSQQLPPLREALEKSGLPFYLAGRSGFADRSDLHFLLSWLRFLALPQGDWLSLSALWTHWPGLGRMAWQALLKAKKSGIADPLHVLHDRMCLAGLAKRPQQACLRLLEALLEDRLRAQRLPPAELLDAVVGRFQGLATTRSFPLPEAESLAILRPYLASASSLPEALTRILLQRDADPSLYPLDRIALLTIHASKGLEFPVVFVAGCEEGILPSPLAADLASLAEETRLLYVAITRVRQHLFLSCARLRQTLGQTHQAAPSPLLAPLQPFLLWQKPSFPSRSRPSKVTPPPSSSLQFDLFSDT